MRPGVEFEDLAPGPAPQLPIESFQRRREQAAQTLEDDQVLVVATHAETTYSNDVEHRFRPHSDFWYLTGFAEPGCVLTIGSDGRTDLWLRPRKPEAEVWTGRRLGIERAQVLGVDHAHDSTDLAGLKRSIGARKPLARTAHHPVAHAALAGLDPADARPMLSSMRRIKDAQEIALLQRAADIGMEAMREALPLAQAGRRESEVEGALLRRYRAAGSTGPGYPPIVGAGANAAILHYIGNQAPIREGDLVLVDAGCEWGYYNSDITRTVPASGHFTPLQADLYEAVQRAQEAALRSVVPGKRFRDPHDAAVEVLVDALVDQGYLEGDKDELIEKQAQRSFFMHGTSHYLGLDVHDPGEVKEADGESVRLEAGMCLTVEPGLYFNPDFAPCPDEAAGIGIRLENDVVVTEDGHLDLVGGLPARLDDVLAALSPPVPGATGI